MPMCYRLRLVAQSVGISPSSACARHLLVQRHLHESDGIWLCLFLPVPPGLLSSPSTKRGNSSLVPFPGSPLLPVSLLHFSGSRPGDQSGLPHGEKTSLKCLCRR